ncbi:DUF397 domain-containing protein [Streptomyces griseocarneus]|nr:DUF397 domain-containing protein [Streptomyces griseocarneus]
MVLSESIWRTSSYSSGNGQCVETASRGEAAVIRDSKDRRSFIELQDVAWSSFVNAVRSDGIPINS